jgi:hypothetical protein
MRSRHRVASTASALALLPFLALACGAREDASATWPPGALLVARRAPLAQMLDELARLDGTRLGRRSRALAGRLPDCERVEARSAQGDLEALALGAGCAPSDPALDPLHRALEGRDLVFAWPLGDGRQLRGSASLDATGGATLSIFVPEGAVAGARSLLMPDAEPPGPPLLSDAAALLHARLRPAGGIDLAALVPAGSQGDRLFRLKSRLFTGAVLDGTWEIAIYLPAREARMPRSALALGFRHGATARAAAEEFVDEIRRTWPVRRTDFAVGEAIGAGLLDLRVLPELAPCYVATDGALVIGWNPASVRAALGTASPGAATAAAEPVGPKTAGALGDGGGLVIDLERVAEADAAFSRRAATTTSSPLAWPWARVRAETRRVVDGIDVRVRLASRGGT